MRGLTLRFVVWIVAGVTEFELSNGANSTGTSLKDGVEALDRLNLCSKSAIVNSPCLEIKNCSTDSIGRECVFKLNSLLLNGGTASTSIAANGDAERENAPPSSFAVWSFGLISVGIISLSGITGAVLWPITESPLYGHIITTLVGLATGSLTSTALFQLIPEAFELTTDVSPNYLNTSAVALMSVWSLFSIECLAKILFRRRRIEHKTNGGIGGVSLKKIEASNFQESAKQAEKLLTDDNALALNPKKKVGTVAWMIIFGDGLHNFIDGMTIGAGYSRSISTGLGLSLAVACEEFPHELGDFAILLQSGMSLKKAMLYNFASACTAFGGLAIGIILGQLEGSHYIFALAGGLFLYISLSHLIPEMKAAIKNSLQNGGSSPLVLFSLQSLGILGGACLIFFITKYNDFIIGFTG